MIREPLLGTDPIYEARHIPSNSKAKANTRKLSGECFLVKFLDWIWRQLPVLPYPPKFGRQVEWR